ncbi:MAG: YciI family protein [Nitrososphaerales archaeon]
MLEYVVISNLVVEREKTAPHRAAHLDYLTRLKEEGKLRMAGRFSDSEGGLYILVADCFEEAEELAKADPYHANGLRRFTITGWERRL